MLQAPHVSRDLHASRRAAGPAMALIAALLLAALAPNTSARELTARQVKQEAAAIDALVKAQWQAKKVTPTLRTSDSEFLRRAYLDVIGRIPTFEEADTFLTSTDYDKRSKLIDKLIRSKGYDSHMFNYWADVLRLQTRDRNDAGGYYLAWVKESIRKNTPYDKWVYAMLTAEGMTRDNGAAGYFIRDAGMPLDNAALTAQIFLATQIGCAQCHDHPFDKWTQKEFYHFAAFTAGVNTRQRPFQANREAMMSMSKKERAKKFKGYKDFREKSAKLPRQDQQVLRNLIRVNSYGVNDTSKKLTLPKDYKYDDAKPGQVITPEVVFGDNPDYTRGGEREAFAKWMTKPSNPMFARAIANRMWARIMGIGLFEPIDDYNDLTEVSNPKLLKHITDLMVALRFDIEEFQRVLLNTQTYQLSATSEDVPFEKFVNQGARLRRMSAEEIWDSLMTLAVADLDGKEMPKAGGYAGRYGKLAEVDIRGLTPEQLLALPAKLREQSEKERMKYRQKSSDEKRKAMEEVKRKFASMRGKFKTKEEARRAYQRMMAQEMRKASGKGGAYSSFVRASEMPSPMPNGHFLAQFGQSRRDAPGGATTDPSVPQALSMLNGRQTMLAMSGQSVLAQAINKQGTPDQKVRALWLSTLTREPSSGELAMAKKELKDNGYKGYSNLIWALLNSREFLFVQ